MKEADFPRHLTRFLSHYLPGERNSSTHTIISYRDTFKLFLAFCDKEKGLTPEKLTLKSITKELVIGFLDWIEKERKSSISTRNQRLAAIHSFFHYIQKECPENLYEMQKILSISSKKKVKPMIPYLTGNEMKILLEQPDASTKTGLRDLVLMAVLYDTAARVKQLAKQDQQMEDFRRAIQLADEGNVEEAISIAEKIMYEDGLLVRGVTWPFILLDLYIKNKMYNKCWKYLNFNGLIREDDDNSYNRAAQKYNSKARNKHLIGPIRPCPHTVYV